MAVVKLKCYLVSALLAMAAASAFAQQRKVIRQPEKTAPAVQDNAAGKLVFTDVAAFYKLLDTGLQARISERLLRDELLLTARAYKLPAGAMPVRSFTAPEGDTWVYKGIASETRLVVQRGAGGKITGFYFTHTDNEVPFYNVSKGAQRTDSVYKLAAKALEARQSDTVYRMLAAAVRGQVTAAEFGEYAEKALYPFLQTAKGKAWLIRSENGTNHYVAGDNELVITATDSNKISKLYTLQFDFSKKKEKPVPNDNAMATALDTLTDKAIRPKMQAFGAKGVSIGILKGGRRFYYNYGDRGLLKPALPDSATVYDTGSITQTFTAAMLAMLMEKGKVKPEMLLKDCLPPEAAKLPAMAAIRVINLLNHTSGLPAVPGNVKPYIIDSSQPYLDYNSRALLEYLSVIPKPAMPGKEYAFSSINGALAAMVYEHMSGDRDLQLDMQDTIANRLKFNELLFYNMGVRKTQRADGVDEDMKAYEYWDMGAMKYAAGIKMSAADMLTWAQVQLQPGSTLLGRGIARTHKVTFSDKTARVGMGWLMAGNNVIFSRGETGGYRSMLAINLATGTAVTVLVNAKNIQEGMELSLLQAIDGVW